MYFYSLAENRSSLSEMIYILEYSLIKTIGAKLKLSTRKVIKKYGYPVRLVVNDKTIKFERPKSLSAAYLNQVYNTRVKLVKQERALLTKEQKTDMLDQPDPFNITV